MKVTGTAVIKQTHALSQTSKQLVAQLFLCDSLAYTIHVLMEHEQNPETASMGKLNGTNLKPITPILFFNKLMKIAEY
jgi:hypothetical protein